MKRTILIALLLLVPGWIGAESGRDALTGGHVRVRVGTQPGRQVVLGQQTRFFVEILTDSWFTKAPDFPELDLEGAIALMPEQLGSNFTERIEGVTFAGQRRSYVIFPQRAGPLEIPSIVVTLGVAGEDGQPGEPFRLRTNPIRLSVVVPPGAEGISGLVTTPGLSVTEEWSRPLEELAVGNAVRRSVRMEADQALGMLLPALRFEAPDGIAAYAAPPRLDDRVNRGQYRGLRAESVTYVLERPGEFTLPAIELPWWNPETGTLQTETLEARTFQVARASAGDVGPGGAWPDWRDGLSQARAGLREHGLALLALLAATVSIGRLSARALPRVIARTRELHARRSESESHLYRSLEASLRRGTGDEANAYWRWRGALADAAPGGATGVAAALEASGFAPLWTDFERRRYTGEGDTPDPRALGSALRAFRSAARGAATRASAPALGPLNPASASRAGTPNVDRG